MAAWHDAAAASEVAEGTIVGVIVDAQPIALFRLGVEIFALHDRCSHGSARLSDGFVEGECVECPLHQGLIDIRSGAPRGAPVTRPVRRYAVRIIGGRVEVGIAQACGAP